MLKTSTTYQQSRDSPSKCSASTDSGSSGIARPKTVDEILQRQPHHQVGGMTVQIRTVQDDRDVAIQTDSYRHAPTYPLISPDTQQSHGVLYLHCHTADNVALSATITKQQTNIRLGMLTEYLSVKQTLNISNCLMIKNASKLE